MSTKTNKGAAALVTESRQFIEANPNGDRLFAVVPGIPAADALEQASCLLATARDAAYGVAANGKHSFAAGYLIEMAKAVVDSITLPDARAIEEEAQAAGKLAEALADLVSQVQSGSSANEFRAIAALSDWNALKGGAA